MHVRRRARTRWKTRRIFSSTHCKTEVECSFYDGFGGREVGRTRRGGPLPPCDGHGVAGGRVVMTTSHLYRQVVGKSGGGTVFVRCTYSRNLQLTLSTTISTRWTMKFLRVGGADVSKTIQIKIRPISVVGRSRTIAGTETRRFVTSLEANQIVEISAT